MYVRIRPSMPLLSIVLLGEKIIDVRVIFPWMETNISHSSGDEVKLIGLLWNRYHLLIEQADCSTTEWQEKWTLGEIFLPFEL